MSKSLTEIRAQLSDIELSDATFADIEAADVEPLAVLMGDEESWLAERAVYALSRIDSARARQALQAAVDDPRMPIRVAAAVAAKTLPAAESNQILLKLLTDPQPSVRKFAMASASARNSPAVIQRIRQISDAEGDVRLKRMAEERISSIDFGR